VFFRQFCVACDVVKSEVKTEVDWMLLRVFTDIVNCCSLPQCCNVWRFNPRLNYKCKQHHYSSSVNAFWKSFTFAIMPKQLIFHLFWTINLLRKSNFLTAPLHMIHKIFSVRALPFNCDKIFLLQLEKSMLLIFAAKY